jgi:hypothetical protein
MTRERFTRHVGSPWCVRSALCGALLALVGLPAAAFGQGEGVGSIPRLTGPIDLDGDPGDAAWAEVPALPTTMYLPTYRGEVTEETVIRVAHDGESLFVLGHFLDSDPEGIRVNSLYRDRWSGDDVLAVFIDAFNDNQNGLWFMTNAAGIRLDAELSNDGRAQNLSWNTYWDVESRVHEDGWTTELRIPFSGLGFQTVGDEVVMGLAATRLISRKNERVTFPSIDPQYGFRQPSIFQDMRLEGVDASRPIYLTAYALGAASRTPRLTPGATSFDVRTRSDTDLGLDAKVNLSANLTLDLTVNPDFAQVEADDQQINLTRFSLFFPEKRQFFQERSALFAIQTANGSRFFNSRRIGLSDDRQPVRILGGGRVVGRVGEWDLGFLNMQTEGVRGGEPSTNFGVARLRRRVFNEYSSMGAMLTTRLGAAGRQSLALAVDGVFRLFGDDYLRFSVAESADEVLDTSFGDFDAREFDVALTRSNTRGLNYNFTFTRTGASYQPALGFVQRPGVDRIGIYTQYFKYLSPESPIRYLLPGMLLTRFERHVDGSVQSAAYRAWVTVAMKDGSGGWIEPEYFEEDVQRAFPLGDGVVVPAGKYEFAHLWLNYATRPGQLFRVGFDTKIGEFYDGSRFSGSVSPTWNASKHLELGATWEANVLDFETRNESLTTHLARLRIAAAMTVQTSMNAFVQWNSTTDDLAANLRLRHNFREGNDLWLVFNQGLVTDRDPREADQPRPPLRGPSTFIVKYTHTFGG